MSMEKSKNTNGKGSRPRPLSVSYKQYVKNWNKIFKRSKSRIIKQKKGSTMY